jgi:hypothetical protein
VRTCNAWPNSELWVNRLVHRSQRDAWPDHRRATTVAPVHKSGSALIKGYAPPINGVPLPDLTPGRQQLVLDMRALLGVTDELATKIDSAPPRPDSLLGVLCLALSGGRCDGVDAGYLHESLPVAQ